MNQIEHNKVVGKRIVTLRRNQKLSQKEFANKVNTPLYEIRHIEKGMITPSIEKLCLFAEILKVKVSDLNWVD